MTLEETGRPSTSPSGRPSSSMPSSTRGRWRRIDSGIDRLHFTRVIRADPGRAGLLYAGTENGVYASFDDGRSWRSLQLSLPIVPITDLAIKEGDLIAATQGRSFWVMDNLDHIRQLNANLAGTDAHLFTPEVTYRMGGGGRGRRSTTRGTRTCGS